MGGNMKKDLSMDRLCGAENCDWGEDGWGCHGSGENGLHNTPAALPFAARILMLISDIDVEESIQYLINDGGH
jgi:hypothetical protein